MTDTRARTYIKALAGEIQGFLKASPHDKSEAAVFMVGVVNGLATAVRILDGATAEEAFEALESQIATAIGRLYLGGQLDLMPEEDAAARHEPPLDQPCPTFSNAGWGRCMEPLGHTGSHMFRNPATA